MKKNTLLIIVFMIIVGIVPVYAQQVCRVDRILNKTQLNEVEKAVSLYWDGKTPEAIQAVDKLEKIVARDADNWVAAYWASYVSTQIINSGQRGSVYLVKAERYFDIASQAFEKKPDKSAVPYFHALRALIYRFKGREFARKQDWKSYGETNVKAVKELNKGISLSPNNPVLMVMAATGIGRNREPDLSKTIAAVALLEKAQVEFKKVTDRSPADITYWNEHWIGFWLNSLKQIK